MYKRMIILTYALVFFSLFATACSDNNNETYVEPILSQIEVSKLVTDPFKSIGCVKAVGYLYFGSRQTVGCLQAFRMQYFD